MDNWLVYNLDGETLRLHLRQDCLEANRIWLSYASLPTTSLFLSPSVYANG